MPQPRPEEEPPVELTHLLSRVPSADRVAPRRGLPVEDLISPWWVVNRSRVF